MHTLPRASAAVVAFNLAICAVLTAAENPSPQDSRLGPLKDLNGDFSWQPPEMKAAWEERAEAVRLQIRVSLGLWPEPTRTPLNAVIHGKIEGDDYTVEKVFFESMPGFFVTGSLFRPKSVTGKIPAVLCPHGHWPDARVALRDDAAMKTELATGQERFENGGRSAFQSIGVQLARMGCAAFVIDMLGNSDSQQITAELAHGFKKQRPEMIAPNPGQWGLFSPQAESHLQSVMGLQTWNTIRALDFLCSLPEVDPSRLACTGASGGATQTMMLGALDPRLAVTFPCVMVSTGMQGGCTCENASGLRVGTGNIEIAALFAPKPMGLTTAKDWTIDLPEKGFPSLKQVWAITGAPDALQLFAHPEFPHNYNIVTREHIYAFFNQHLGLGLPPERLIERDYTPLTREQQSVWDTEHPAPPTGPELEKRVLKWWADDATQQMTTDMETFARIARPALASLIPTAPDESSNRVTATDAGLGGQIQKWSIRNEKSGTEVSGLLIGNRENHPPVHALILSQKGAHAILDENQKPTPLCAELVNAGFTVISADLWNQPSAAASTMDGAKTRRVENPRESAAYTFGYNLTDTAQRIRDVITILTAFKPGAFTVIALDPENSPIVAAATALSSAENVSSIVVKTGGFRFQNIRDIRDPIFLPGAAKYGDLPGLLALCAPRRLLLIGDGDDLISAAFEAVQVPDTLLIKASADDGTIANWLTGKPVK